MSTSNPTDYLAQPISMGDIVTYTLSARSSNLSTGVVAGYNPKSNRLAVYSPSGWKKSHVTKTHITSGSNGQLTRVQVITMQYIQLPVREQELLDLHDKYKSQQWPSDKPARSIGSPITKWLRSFDRTCGDFLKAASVAYGSSKDADGYLLSRGNQKKLIRANFSTTHHGETVYTHVLITSDNEEVGIYTKKGGYSYNLIDGMGKNLQRYSGKNPEPVFGINWFNHPEIVPTIKDAFERVRNQ